MWLFPAPLRLTEPSRFFITSLSCWFLFFSLTISRPYLLLSRLLPPPPTGLSDTRLARVPNQTSLHIIAMFSLPENFLLKWQSPGKAYTKTSKCHPRGLSPYPYPIRYDLPPSGPISNLSLFLLRSSSPNKLRYTHINSHLSTFTPSYLKLNLWEFSIMQSFHFPDHSSILLFGMWDIHKLCLLLSEVHSTADCSLSSSCTLAPHPSSWIFDMLSYQLNLGIRNVDVAISPSLGSPEFILSKSR